MNDEDRLIFQAFCELPTADQETLMRVAVQVMSEHSLTVTEAMELIYKTKRFLHENEVK